MAISAFTVTQCKMVMQCPPVGILARMVVNLPNCVAVRNTMAETKGNMAAWKRRGGKIKQIKTKVAGGRGETNGVKMCACNI